MALETKPDRLMSPQDELSEWAKIVAKSGNEYPGADPDASGALVRIGDDYWDISRFRFNNGGAECWATIITRLMVGADNALILAGLRIRIIADEVSKEHERAQDPSSSSNPAFDNQIVTLNDDETKSLLDQFVDRCVGTVPPEEALRLYRSHHKAEKQVFRRVRDEFPHETRLARSAHLPQKTGLMRRLLGLTR